MINTIIDYYKITPSTLENFIKDLGWKKIKQYQDNTTVWKSGEYQDVFWLPARNDYDDFPNVVNKILESLSNSTGRDIDEFTEELIQYYNDKDLLKLRVISEDVDRGQIHIQDGTSIYESLQVLLSSAVKHVSGIGQKLKQQFNDDTLLGQTAIGSYIVKTYTPVLEIDDEPEQHDLGQIERKGLGRQIIQKLIIRLNLIISIYKTVNLEGSAVNVGESLLENGFTKKECLAIENLFGSKGHRNWELKVLWAKALDQSKDNTLVKFDHSYSSAANKVVKYLETLQSDMSTVTVEGRVTGLDRDYDEELGTVKLKGRVKKKECTVTLHLNEVDFDVAHSANARRATIKVTGELTETKIGKRKLYEMHNIEELILLQRPENLELNLEKSK
jgi:uncharacterized protein YfeS